MKKLCTTLIFLLLTTSVSAFTDTDSQAINYLSELGIINGYPDGTFKPDNPINRAELLKILMEGSGITIEKPNATCFPDVPRLEWYSPYICTAKNLGYINGYPDGTFRPDKPINKVEALKIIGKIYDWPLDTETNLFKDTYKTAWYAPYLSYAKSENLLIESGLFYEPAKNITRGSVSETIYRTIKDLPPVEKSTPPNISPIEILAPGETQIILIWEAEDTDLDLHLIKPTGEEIYFMFKTDPEVHTLLITEETSETLILRNIEEGNYELFIHKFTEEKNLSQTGAKIEIHDSKGLAKIYYPPEGEGKIWKLFNLNNTILLETNRVGECDLIEGTSAVCPISI